MDYLLTAPQICRYPTYMNAASSAPSALKLRRLARGLTLDDVSRATKIDRSDLSRIERGVMPLREGPLKALAAFYQEDPTVLTQEVA